MTPEKLKERCALFDGGKDPCLFIHVVWWCKPQAHNGGERVDVLASPVENDLRHRRFCQLHLLQHFNRDHCLTRLGAFILGAVDKVTGFGWKLEEQTVATRVSIELRMIKK